MLPFSGWKSLPLSTLSAPSEHFESCSLQVSRPLGLFLTNDPSSLEEALLPAVVPAFIALAPLGGPSGTVLSNRTQDDSALLNRSIILDSPSRFRLTYGHFDLSMCVLAIFDTSTDKRQPYREAE